MPARGYSQAEWRVIRRIGEGAQGRASLVEHRRTGRFAVRKKADDYDLLDRDIPSEPFILQEVLPSSSNIVRMIHYETGGNSTRSEDLILWYEYCPGGDLQHAVEELGRLPEDFIWHCFIQIAHALDTIHNCGSRPVVHRDIKPDNIFLETTYRHHAPWPNLKVGDFGSAVLKENTAGIHVPCWQGPEIPHLSSAGDIWGLGAIIHWLCHGQPPMMPRPRDFPGSVKDWETLPEARKPVPLPRLYSSKLNDYMLDCLEWDPRDRISSRMLVDALERDRPRPRR